MESVTIEVDADGNNGMLKHAIRVQGQRITGLGRYTIGNIHFWIVPKTTIAVSSGSFHADVISAIEGIVDQIGQGEKISRQQLLDALQ